MYLSLPEDTGTALQLLAWRIPCTEEPGGLRSTGRPGSGTTEHTHASPTGAPRSGRERKAWTDALLGTYPAHRPLMMKPQGAGPLAAGAHRGSAEPASHVPGARLRGGERRAARRPFRGWRLGNTCPPGAEPPLGWVQPKSALMEAGVRGGLGNCVVQGGPELARGGLGWGLLEGLGGNHPELWPLLLGRPAASAGVGCLAEVASPPPRCFCSLLHRRR